MADTAGMSQVQRERRKDPSLSARRRSSLQAVHARVQPDLSAFDRTCPVELVTPEGRSPGVGRNLSRLGMFVESSLPCGLGTRVQVVFEPSSDGSRFVAHADVRFGCLVQYADASGDARSSRGLGLRFVSFDGVVPPALASLLVA